MVVLWRLGSGTHRTSWRQRGHDARERTAVAQCRARRLVDGGGLALPNKIGLPAEEYFIAQQIYAGWALIGIAILGAMASTLALAVLVRRRSAEFRLVVTALACIVLSLAIFFAFTFPANQATENWTTRPAEWETLRSQWEYSHAVGALVYLTALIALTLSLLVRGNRAEPSAGRRDVDVG